MPENGMEVIEVMTEEQWREKYIHQARAEARARQNRWNEKHERDNERRVYFANQKFFGVIWITIVSVLTVIIRNPTCLVLMLPGIGMIVTKKMVIVNRYYYEHGGPMQWEG